MNEDRVSFLFIEQLAPPYPGDPAGLVHVGGPTNYVVGQTGAVSALPDLRYLCWETGCEEVTVQDPTILDVFGSVVEYISGRCWQDGDILAFRATADLIQEISSTELRAIAARPVCFAGFTVGLTWEDLSWLEQTTEPEPSPFESDPRYRARYRAVAARARSSAFYPPPDQTDFRAETIGIPIPIRYRRHREVADGVMLRESGSANAARIVLIQPVGSDLVRAGEGCVEYRGKVIARAQ